SWFGDQTFPHQPLADGEQVAVGNLCLRALWTPGHTPEHLAYLLIDPARGSDPVALFSGDALFVGEVGRPDLLGEEQTRTLAEHLYRTVTGRLSRLDDALVVYPGHTAGSACGKQIGDAPTTTIGQEKRYSYAFQARSPEAFVRMVLDGMPKPPTYYPILKRVNRDGPAPLAALPAGQSLTPNDVAARQADGALVVDTRSPQAFGTGHVPGAVFAGLGPNFPAWMGWLAPYDRDLILVLDADERYPEALTDLRRIGLDRVAGFLASGIDAWREAGLGIEHLPQIPVPALAAHLDDPNDGLTVLDVRNAEEWSRGHIPGAIHCFAGEIAQGAEPPLKDAGRIAVICGSGYRSSVAASLLAQRGWSNLANVPGGMNAWTEASLPTTQR
ncbi:MAG: rhodanese-like domain-containing protein, partial [Chloroflexota bacterium]|nr:rhodanese-like domain-containing protein [Chloroflexota bacterium]